MRSPASARCASTVCKCFRVPFEAYRARRHRAPGSSALDAAQTKSPQLAAGLKSAPRRPILIYTLRSARILYRWRYARSENSPVHRFDRFEICVAVAPPRPPKTRRAAPTPPPLDARQFSPPPQAARTLLAGPLDPRDDATWSCARPPHAQRRPDAPERPLTAQRATRRADAPKKRPAP